MPRSTGTAIQAAPRKTLLEWIESDDGDTTSFTPPACSSQARALHARILRSPGEAGSDGSEPLQPPSGLRLAPLG